MLSFSKGINNQKNIDTNKYSKLGRTTPQEIIQKKYENNMNNLNQPKKEEPMKTVEQRNNGAELYNKLNAYRNLNK